MIKNNDLENNKYIVYLSTTNKNNKKFRAIIYHKNRKKTVYFGSSLHSDYRLHRDHRRMFRYLYRHGAQDLLKLIKKVFNVDKFSNLPENITEKQAASFLKIDSSIKENWQDPFTAGFWSRWFLWGFLTEDQCKPFLENKFNIEFKEYLY